LTGTFHPVYQRALKSLQPTCHNQTGRDLKSTS
jgi:hypothetical protein